MSQYPVIQVPDIHSGYSDLSMYQKWAPLCERNNLDGQENTHAINSYWGVKNLYQKCIKTSIMLRLVQNFDKNNSKWKSWLPFVLIFSKGEITLETECNFLAFKPLSKLEQVNHFFPNSHYDTRQNIFRTELSPLKVNPVFSMKMTHSISLKSFVWDYILE